MSKEFDAFLASRGIKHQFTVPYTSQQNGVAERKNRSLMEMWHDVWLRVNSFRMHFGLRLLRVQHTF